MIKKTSDIFIKDTDLVTVTKMNHLIEMQYMEKRNSTNHIQKLDKDRYVDKRTGQIKEFEHINNRSESQNSLRQTFKKLRYLINNNFAGNANELFITLTYRGDLQTRDTKRIYADFNKFMKRLKYKFKSESTIDYINVIEPHESGNFHMHVLMRFNGLSGVYIPNDELRGIWGNGWVTIESLKDVDNIGAYVSAYLTDIELTDQMELGTALKVQGQGLEVKTVEGKKFIKGGRLHMYPPGINIFRKSKGIQEPVRKNMSYKNAKKIVGAATPHYTQSYKIETEDFSNVISYEQYNMKRHDL